ncbi:MAG: peptidoglycan-binding protein [Leptolyngbyaceae cyanobacterium CRU_2_3]|nr:peptidoglycan-binding protein [Leptolyngbyaceae cyanobacterium CRU_2_3]
MEVLAYLHLAQDYENPGEESVGSLADGLLADAMGFSALEGIPLSNSAALGLVSLLCCSWMMGLSQVAQAQTYSSEGLYPSSVYAFEDNSTLNSSAAPSYLTSENSIYSTERYAYVQPDVGAIAYGRRYAYPCANVASYPLYPSTYVPLRPTVVRSPARDNLGLDGLELGDSGEAVRQLQDLLKNTGYFNSPSTGYFGTTTASAVIAFQQDYGLVADGVVGSSTLAALQGRDYRPLRPSDDILQYGDRGAQVSQVQRALNGLGYYDGTIDGVFGASTAASVRAFQRDYGLSADGVVGAVTLGTLQAL